jgi:hypothetical protein
MGSRARTQGSDQVLGKEQPRAFAATRCSRRRRFWIKGSSARRSLAESNRLQSTRIGFTRFRVSSTRPQSALADSEFSCSDERKWRSRELHRSARAGNASTRGATLAWSRRQRPDVAGCRKSPLPDGGTSKHRGWIRSPGALDSMGSRRSHTPRPQPHAFRGFPASPPREFREVRRRVPLRVHLRSGTRGAAHRPQCELRRCSFRAGRAIGQGVSWVPARRLVSTL